MLKLEIQNLICYLRDAVNQLNFLVEGHSETEYILGQIAEELEWLAEIYQLEA